MVEQSASKDVGLGFRIKNPSKNSGSYYIQEITHDFTDIDTTAEVLCVKFEENDKFIGASYSSGLLRVFNSYTGKAIYLLVNNSNSGSSSLMEGEAT